METRELKDLYEESLYDLTNGNTKSLSETDLALYRSGYLNGIKSIINLLNNHSNIFVTELMEDDMLNALSCVEEEHDNPLDNVENTESNVVVNTIALDGNGITVYTDITIISEVINDDAENTTTPNNTLRYLQNGIYVVSINPYLLNNLNSINNNKWFTLTIKIEDYDKIDEPISINNKCILKKYIEIYLANKYGVYF